MGPPTRDLEHAQFLAAFAGSFSRAEQYTDGIDPRVSLFLSQSKFLIFRARFGVVGTFEEGALRFGRGWQSNACGCTRWRIKVKSLAQVAPYLLTKRSSDTMVVGRNVVNSEGRITERCQTSRGTTQ